MQAQTMQDGTNMRDGQDKGGSSTGNVETMLDFNALQYEMFPDLSVATERTFKNAYFQRNEYNNDVSAYCVLNSGSDFIDGRNSYMIFTIGVGGDANTVATWGKFGSAYNIIKRIILTDRAGNELERIEDVNRIIYLNQRLCNDNTWKSNYGSQFNYSLENFNPLNTDDNTKFNLAPGDTSLGNPNVSSIVINQTTWVLPLRYMSGLFDYDQLLPSQLMSGLRIQIDFELAENAIRLVPVNNEVVTAAGSYVIQNPRIVLDSVKLTDSIYRELNERAANDGLEIMYRTWWTNVTSITGQNDLNIESRKAVSRAFRVIAAVYQTYDTTNALTTQAKLNRNNLIPSTFDWSEYQFRAGNLYFPNQKVSGSLQSVCKEAFHHVQRLFSKHKEYWWPNGQKADTWIRLNIVPASQELTSSDVGDFYGRAPCICADLERTTVQDLSGIPLNNSRVLALNGKLFNPNPANTTASLYMFLQHLKIARVFMDNTEIEE